MLNHAPHHFSQTQLTVENYTFQSSIKNKHWSKKTKFQHLSAMGSIPQFSSLSPNPSHLLEQSVWEQIHLGGFFSFKIFFCLFCVLKFWVQLFLLSVGFSSCGKQGLLSSCGARASHCSGFSGCRAQAQELWRGFSCCKVCGIKSVSPALAGRFVTTRPPGEVHTWVLTPALLLTIYMTLNKFLSFTEPGFLFYKRTVILSVS